LLGPPQETDLHRLEQRAKQLAKGKETPEYTSFAALLPAGRRGAPPPPVARIVVIAAIGH
jgi:hypothetical protein